MKNSPMPPRKKRLENKTPLKPGGQIERKTRLKAVKEIPPGSPGQKETGNPPKRKPAPKPAYPKRVPAAVKNLLKERSGGLCEVGLTCRGQAAGVDPAHREGKKSGGTRKWWSNLAANLTWSCRACHDLIDNHAVRGAEKLGLKLREGVARPWEIPVQHARLGWVLLDNDGGHRPAPTASYERAGKPLIPVVSCTTWELIKGDGEFAEALKRYGHADCAGRPAPREGLYGCGCGSAPFTLQEVA